MIPKKLQQKGIRFVLLEKKGKKPFQKEWQNKKINFDDAELISHLNTGGNYGVLGGGLKQLLIVDFDNERVQEQVCLKLPKTFTVKTGSGKLHKYFISDRCESFKIFDEEMNTLADIQGDGKQVVGPESIHPNGNKYKVIDDSDINYISYSELKAILNQYDKRPKKEKRIYEKPKVDLDDDFLDKLKSNISMEDVLNSFGIDVTKNPTECYFHSSSGGKCLGFTNEVAHCFHCDGSWNIFSFVKEAKKCDFKKALEELSSLAGLEEELKESKLKFKQNQFGFFNEASQILTYQGQGKKFAEIQPLFYDKNCLFWLWNTEKTKWEIVDEIDILNMIAKATGQDIINPKNRTIILNTLKQEGRKRIPKPIKLTWIQFKNMIMDISTGETFEATPKYFVTNPLPYQLHPEKFEDTPIMDKIFEEWVGKNNIRQLYEILAYCMLPDYPIHRLFCFMGGGLNGKSKYLDLLKKFIGQDNCCTTELDTLMQSRFEITRLHKKLVCQMGETNFNEMSKTSTLKKLTGGDLIGYEYKNKNPFEEYNYAKILIATNNLPTTTDKTIGFYRRWMIIDFPNEFSEKKDILLEIPEKEYESLALKCSFILKELLNKRSFTNEGSIEERKERYEARSNFLEEFITKFTTLDVDGYITKADFYKKFTSWCKENRHREMSETSVGLSMKKLGVEGDRKHLNWMNDGKGGTARIWRGIIWTE